LQFIWLELAGYVMKKLAEDQVKIEELAHRNFDGNKKFVLAVVDFLHDIGWMGEDEKNIGCFIMTEKGRREYRKYQALNFLLVSVFK
jgi:predicted transcriptional regulator